MGTGPPTGRCPDCGRDGLVLRQPNELLPRHKAKGEPADWPNPQAAGPSGWCRGSGRWVRDQELTLYGSTMMG